MSVLEGARVVLCVTGSIAAYKAADLASKLTQAGTAVDVALTDSAEQFTGAVTFEALTQRPVYSGSRAMTVDSRIAHVELARSADAVVFAPATAASLARLAHGQTDDLPTAIAVATEAPVVAAPAMEPRMYTHPATAANLAVLRQRGVLIVEPEEGRLASGAAGKGRLPATDALIDAIRIALGRGGALAGRSIVISAGGTREYVDPVRFLGNPATGAQGVALARSALERGASVRLVLGAASVAPPYGVQVHEVTTADEMLGALQQAVEGCDALIMNAAVGDYRPAYRAASKIKRGGGGLSLELVENAGVLNELRGDFVRIGFAAETDDHLANARKKLHALDLDAIVVNDVSQPDRGFAAETNAVTILPREGEPREVSLTSKAQVADAVLDAVGELLEGR